MKDVERHAEYLRRLADDHVGGSTLSDNGVKHAQEAVEVFAEDKLFEPIANHPFRKQ